MIFRNELKKNILYVSYIVEKNMNWFRIDFRIDETIIKNRYEY